MKSRRFVICQLLVLAVSVSLARSAPVDLLRSFSLTSGVGWPVSLHGCCPLLCPNCVCFWRATVASVATPAWKACLPIGCLPGCEDAGWPKPGTLPNDSYVDAGILTDTSPLILYEVADVGNLLRVVKSGGTDVTVSY